MIVFQLSTRLNHGFNCSNALANEIKQNFNVSIDPSTLRKIRRGDNLVYRRVRASPKLEDLDKAMRFIWCEVMRFYSSKLQLINLKSLADILKAKFE